MCSWCQSDLCCGAGELPTVHDAEGWRETKNQKSLILLHDNLLSKTSKESTQTIILFLSWAFWFQVSNLNRNHCWLRLQGMNITEIAKSTSIRFRIRYWWEASTLSACWFVLSLCSPGLPSHKKKKKKHFDAKSRNTLQQNCDREHGVLQSCKPSLKCTRTNHTFQTISSRHEQILPYLSGNNLSLGGFWHTSLIDAVMMKITSATRGQQTHC